MIEKVSVEKGHIGSAKIEHFNVPENDLHYRLSVMRTGRGVPPGDYTRLLVNGRLMMSDTPDEMQDHRLAVFRASNSVLITGLGLGMVANAIASKECVTDVTVIEISQDVIDLVSSSLSPKVTVTCADAFEWRPPKDKRYGTVWHDIWPDLCTDNLQEMTKLKRRFGRRCDGWQGCWGEEILRAQKRREDREERMWAWS